MMLEDSHHDGVAELACRGHVMYFLCVRARLFKHYLNGGCVPGERRAEVTHSDAD